MADEESRAAILGKGHKCAQDMRIWGLAAPPASCRLLQPRANTPCLSVALCSAGVILAGRTLGGGGGLSTRLSLLLSLLLSHPTDTATHLHLFTPIRSLGLRIPPPIIFPSLCPYADCASLGKSVHPNPCTRVSCEEPRLIHLQAPGEICSGRLNVAILITFIPLIRPLGSHCPVINCHSTENQLFSVLWMGDRAAQ